MPRNHNAVLPKELAIYSKLRFPFRHATRTQFIVKTPPPNFVCRVGIWPGFTRFARARCVGIAGARASATQRFRVVCAKPLRPDFARRERRQSRRHRRRFVAARYWARHQRQSPAKASSAATSMQPDAAGALDAPSAVDPSLAVIIGTLNGKAICLSKRFWLQQPPRRGCVARAMGKLPYRGRE